MASGLSSIKGLYPDEEEYGMIKDAKVKEVLKYIFNEDEWKKNPKKGISKVAIIMYKFLYACHIIFPL